MSKPEKTIAPETRCVVDPVFATAAKRVMERCDVLGGISEEEGRITRTFLSPATKRAQEVVAGWMREAGLVVRVDAAGNVIGRREAARADANVAGKTFVVGSHLDTVPNAGKYDGILGVVAGIEMAELMRDVVFPFALEVVGFSEEEGVRFGKPYIGSHAYAGTLDATWLELKDKDGVTVEGAIEAFGLDAAGLRTLGARGDLLGYLEIHIEQGPMLESSNDPIAVVGTIVGQTRITLEFSGSAGHAGTVPMRMRRDALAAAAEAILLVESAAADSIGNATHPLLATVGRIVATPNASNVIAGSVQMSLNVRSADDGVRRQSVDRVLRSIEEIAERRHIEMRVVSTADFPAVQMDDGLSNMLRGAAEPFCGVNSVMVSGAGHDAAIMKAVAPTAMLFVRSPGGISHSPLESVIEGDVAIALATGDRFLRQLREVTQEPA